MNLHFKRLAHYKFPQKSQKAKYSVCFFLVVVFVFSWGKFKNLNLNTGPCKPVSNILLKVLSTEYESKLDLQTYFEV